MRIAWATPWNLRSAIGRGNAAVADALAARGHAVEVIQLEADPPADPIPTALPVRHWRQVDLARLKRDHDAVVVHFGDHFPFHAGGLPLIGAAPAVGVFHDLGMYNFFNGWVADRQGGAALHDDEIVGAYGRQARAFAEEARSGRLDLGEIAARTPMVEWLARHCAGALTHAEHYAGRVAAACAGPVAVAPRPWPPRPVPPLRPRGRPELVCLTVGVMNRNKCAEETIRAIAGSPRLKGAVRYHLVGRISDDERARLTAVAAETGYAGLSIFGDVNAAALEARLREADMIACLRRPILEGASGSVIEALQSGRPTVVADAGCYADVPDGLALKVPAEVPIEALRAALETLAADEPLRRDIGARAARWAKARFTAENYAAALEPLIQATLDAQPVLHLAAHLGSELATLGLTRDDPVIEGLAARLAPVLAPKPL
ncbi:MAG: glycosyltransferase family 4 protein [Caulobacteraceae bacterium]|nr:glycosyltransferase family 4 protein [Caulobacteraceae bacterium]